MKISTAPTLIALVSIATTAPLASAADCDMAAIEAKLYPNATEGLANCEEATGIDIFAVNEFPTTEQVTTLSETLDCVNYLNQINQVANAEIQCNVTVEGVTVNYGTLIADFLTAHTGNESDSDSGSIEFESESESASESGSAELESASDDSESGSDADPETELDADSASKSGSNAASSATALAYVAYGVASAIAVALL